MPSLEPAELSRPVSLPRPANGIAVVTLVLVFLGGGATGAVLMRVREHRVHVPASATSSKLTSTVADWKKQLDLSDDQTQQIVSILDDFSQYYDNVLADGNSRIMQVLKPDQQKRFEQLLRERRH